MSVMSLPEALFVLLETPSRPMHLGALALFDPPPDAEENAARRLIEQMCAGADVAEALRRRPIRPVRGAGYPWWIRVGQIDLGYHVRHAAVPGSGSMADLLALVSQIHEIPLVPQHPMWEVHLIEGLDDGRLAVYAKVHLSLVDGPAGLRMLFRSLSSDPDARDCPPPWNPDAAAAAPEHRSIAGTLLGSGMRAGRELVSMAPALTRFTAEGLRKHELTLPLQSPPTMFNVDGGRARTLAIRSWPITRLRTIAAATGASVDAVVLGMCAGALRAYLHDRYALPDTPLTALLPVPLDLGQTAVGPGGHEPGSGAMVVELATDEPDPAARLARIAAALTHTDRLVGALSRTQFLVLSALALSPLALEPVRRFTAEIPPPFNVLISYLPGPARPRYWNGAHLSGVYPVPALLPGQGLSITLTGTDGRLDLGVVGDRHAAPHLDRLVCLLDESLADLERAVCTATR